MKSFLISVVSILVSFTSFSTEKKTGQHQPDSTQQQSIIQNVSENVTTEEKEEKKVRLNSIRISGFSRLVGYYRNMQQFYEPGIDNVSLLRGLTLPVTVGIGDGSGNPAFMLRMEASAAKKTSVLMELGLHHNFGAWNTGVYAPGAQFRKDGKVATIFSRFALEAKTVNDYGTFKLMAGGGMNWGKLSPFTLWTFQYRDDMFERYPWDPAGSNWKRYGFFYSLGDIPRDLRWGNRSIQGFRVDLEDLPYNLSGTFIFGRTVGIWESWIQEFPQKTISWRLAKNFSGKHIGINYYNQFGSQGQNFYRTQSYTVNADSSVTALVENKNSQLVITSDLKYNYKGKMRFYAEMGVGSYLDPLFVKQNFIDEVDPVTGNPDEVVNDIDLKHRFFSPLLYAEADFKKAAFGFPFKVSGFYIGRYAVNNSSAIINSSLESAGNGLDLSGTGGVSNNNTFFLEGMITEIGQTTNNRTGGSFTTTKKVKGFVFELGLGIQQELVNFGNQDTLPSGAAINGQRGASFGASQAGIDVESDGVTNSVTLYHLVNQFQRSRFEYNNRFSGPYRRLVPDFRRHWENIAITDTVVDYKKSFTMFDFQMKHKTTLFGKEIIWAAFFRGNAVTDQIAPHKLFSKEAFVRQYYEELIGFYHIAPKWTLIAFAATEQVKGNNRTELADENGFLIDDENRDGVYDPVEDDAARPDGKPVFDPNGKPIDQLGIGLGAGFDYDFTDNASIDVRYRWISHEDKNFTQDVFNGHDVTVEFKVFF